MSRLTRSSATFVAGYLASDILDAWSNASAELRAERVSGLRQSWLQERWMARVEAVREAMRLLAQLQDTADPSTGATEIVSRLRELRESVADRTPAGTQPSLHPVEP
jgi:hypothetical protein